MGKEREFQFYRIHARDDRGRPVNLESKLMQADVFEGNFDDLEVERTGGDYYHEFYDEDRNLKYGRIVKTKEGEDYFARSTGGTVRLSEKMQEELGIGEIQGDITNFGMLIDGSELIILLEIGFQTPGIGVVREFIHKILNNKLNEDVRVISEWVEDEETDQKLRELLDEPVKKAEIRMKKRPSEIAGDTPEATASNLQPDNYSLRLEWSVRKENKDEATKLSGLFSKALGTDEDNVYDTLQQIDYPNLLSTFKVDGFGEENTDEEISENLLKTIKFVEIEIEEDRLSAYDDVGRELCEILRSESDSLVSRTDF